MMKLRQYHFSWLLAMAAGLAMTAMTACSSENGLTETPIVEQPEQPTAKGVKVTVTAGISDGAATRSEVGTENGKRVLKFTTGDQLYIYGDGESGYNLPNMATYVKGFLTMEGSPSADGKSASFTGTLKAYDNNNNPYSLNVEGDPLVGTTATLIHEGLSLDEGYWFFNDQSIDLKDVARDADSYMTSCLYVTGDYDSDTKSYSLSSSGPIFNCTISGLAASQEYYFDFGYYSSQESFSKETSESITTDADGTAQFAFSTYKMDSHDWKLRIKDNTDNHNIIGAISLGTRSFEKKVYNITRQWAGNCFAKSVSGEVNLASVNDNIVVLNGSTLSGTLGSNVKVSIADGATVTLDGVTINGTDDSNYAWAGITCLGDATIILKNGSTNIVKGFCSNYPGIHVPSGKTLTIQGYGPLYDSSNGWLDASSNGNAAGIGGGSSLGCGNIAIEGGNVTATGGQGAAGIGSGANGSCGDITISGARITATKGSDAPNSIGAGNNATCGTVTIGGKEYWKNNAYLNDGDTYLAQSSLTYPTLTRFAPVNRDPIYIYYYEGETWGQAINHTSGNGRWRIDTNNNNRVYYDDGLWRNYLMYDDAYITSDTEIVKSGEYEWEKYNDVH